MTGSQRFAAIRWHSRRCGLVTESDVGTVDVDRAKGADTRQPEIRGENTSPDAIGSRSLKASCFQDVPILQIHERVDTIFGAELRVFTPSADLDWRTTLVRKIELEVCSTRFVERCYKASQIVFDFITHMIILSIVGGRYEAIEPPVHGLADQRSQIYGWHI